MPIKLNSTGGGSVTLDTGSTASNFTLTVPSNTGTLVSSASSAAVTPTMLSQPFTFVAGKSATGLGNVDFTGIPSWVRWIQIAYYSLSTTSTGGVGIRVGTAGSPETTGYLSSSSQSVNGVAPAVVNVTTGFNLDGINNAAAVRHGTATLMMTDTNVWAASGVGGRSDIAAISSFGGRIVLTGSLDIVRIYANADTFDSGYVSIAYAG